MASQWHLQLLPQQRHLHLRRLPQVQLQGTAQEVQDLQGMKGSRVNKTEVNQRIYWILHGFHMVLHGFYRVLFGSMAFECILFSRKLSL
jgi:hypothetical protein